MLYSIKMLLRIWEMKEITKNEQREIQLELMAYIDKICREQGIDYSIGAGTLLGSVKYKGYIPWDDDIDMMLTRPNYEDGRRIRYIANLLGIPRRTVSDAIPQN
jgi:tRNA nucleotidyltransferase (CCA-adding enzyme)